MNHALNLPAWVAALWMRGLNTAQIARVIGLTEAEVYNLRARSKDGGGR